LLSQLTGTVLPDSGSIRLRGRPITHLPPYRRSALGIARSFQITNVFQDLTAVQNVALGVQSRQGHSYRFWRSVHRDDSLTGLATARLRQVGLEADAHVHARALSHGQRRQLEIAMALATEPEVLLLDEPMAGMGPEESAAMVEILRGLKGEKTIVLVEHDLDAVFALADRITVLVFGRVIACDVPAAIRAHPEVRQAYLGEDWDEE
jgi:branched-chain amino acid transport system ATP-binding protein